MPTNSILTIHNQTVMVQPIMDQYYDRSPHHHRSAAFVRTKGLAANEKAGASTPLAVPLPAPNVELETHKKYLPVIPFNTSRSRTPETSSSIPRAKTPLSHIESAPTPASVPIPTPTSTPAPTSTPTPGDIRSITQPQILRSAPQQPPAQGNIKKKRASLTTIEAFPGHVHQDSSPVTPEPARTEFGNPNKIAQYFPELSIP